jgi:hypothetical protein
MAIFPRSPIWRLSPKRAPAVILFISVPLTEATEVGVVTWKLLPGGAFSLRVAAILPTFRFNRATVACPVVPKNSSTVRSEKDSTRATPLSSKINWAWENGPVLSSAPSGSVMPAWADCQSRLSGNLISTSPSALASKTSTLFWARAVLSGRNNIE